MNQRFHQLLCNYGVGMAAIGLSVGMASSLLPKTILIDKMRTVEHYVEKDGEERKISQENLDLIENVLSKFKLHPNEQNNISFFTSSLSDPTYYGSVKVNTGTLIGLPVTLDYNKPSRLMEENLSFGGIRLDLNHSSSEAATQLANSLMLSDKAKAFLVARQLSYVISYNLHFEVLLKSAILVSAVFSLHRAQKYYHEFLSRLKPIPYLMLGATVLCGWGLVYMGLNDGRKCRMDYVADRKAALLGKEFAEGGVEYYESLLLRNKSLRVLTKSSHKRFTAFGNEATTLRQNGLQVTTRRDNMAKLLSSYVGSDVVGGGDVVNEVAK